MSRRRLLTLLTALSSLLCVAVVALWVRPFSYSRAVDSGKSAIPYARQFDRAFPGSSHSIGYFTGTHGNPTWRSSALVHGRYEIRMQVPVRLNTLRNGVSSYGEPRFWLWEVAELSSTPGGRDVTTYGPTQIQFGLPEWQRLVESGGDLSRLGIQIDTDRPVRGLAEQWRRTHP